MIIRDLLTNLEVYMNLEGTKLRKTQRWSLMSDLRSMVESYIMKEVPEVSYVWKNRYTMDNTIEQDMDIKFKDDYYMGLYAKVRIKTIEKAEGYGYKKKDAVLGLKIFEIDFERYSEETLNKSIEQFLKDCEKNKADAIDSQISKFENTLETLPETINGVIEQMKKGEEVDYKIRYMIQDLFKDYEKYLELKEGK